DDVRPDPEIFDLERTKAASSFWLGPRGTRTPLHHDTTNILFFQIHGRKRVLLVDPREDGLLDDLDGFYSRTRPGDAFARAFPGARVHEVLLSPGEALFIPAGYLHEVEALEVSVNVSLLGFRRPNDYTAYHPGSPYR